MRRGTLPNCHISEPLRRFVNVNRRGRTGSRRGWQKHHLLPRQTFGRRSFSAMFSSISPRGEWFDDFNVNGILLPATEAAAFDSGLPLHRGPHQVYNELVFERVGAVEMEWSHTRSRDELLARDVALARIRLIQRGLARGLEMGGAGPFVLNRRDPIGRGKDYSELDAMAEVLWGAVGTL